MAGLTLSPIVLGFAVIFAFAKADLSKFAWGDFLMIGLFVMALAWLSLPTRDQPACHEQAGQGFAFRLGKSLNRIWRGNGG
jgi:hypothetical protein